MKCPFCGKYNPDKATTCEECGSPLSQQNDIVEIIEANEIVEDAVIENSNIETEEKKDQKPAGDSFMAKVKRVLAVLGEFFCDCGRAIKNFFTKDLKNIGNKDYVKEHKKNYIVAGSSFLVVVALVVVLCFAFAGGSSNGGRVPVEDGLLAVADVNTGKVQIGDKEVNLEDGAKDVKQAGDGTVIYTNDEGGQLKILDENGNPIILTESLYNYNISPDGTITFMADTEDYLGQSVCSLYFYDKKTNETVLLAKNVVKYSNFNSYDGNSIAYTQVTEDGFVLYVIADKTNPTPVKIDTAPDGMTAMAVSNGGTLVFYEKCSGEKQTIGVYDSGKTEEFATFTMPLDDSDPENVQYIFNSSNIYLNQTGTEGFVIVLEEETGNAYYKKAGSAAVTLSEKASNLTFVAPKFGDNSLYTPMTRSCVATYYPITNFSNVAYTTQGEYSIDLYLYTPGSSSAEMAVEGVTGESFITSDLSTLFYLYGNELTTVSLTGSKVGDPKIIAEDAVVYAASSDASTIYYINYMMELYKVQGSGSPEKIAEGISNQVCATDKTGSSVVYYASYSQDTGMGELVMRTGSDVKTIAKDVHFKDATETLGRISYYKNVTGSVGAYIGDLYHNVNGKETLEMSGATFK